MANELALVTGASSGIGYSLANELASRGYDLIIASAGERIRDAAASLESHGTQVMAVQADLATHEGVEELWSAVTRINRSLDVVCINAGVGVGGLFWETDLEDELNMVNLNCTGAVQLAKYVVRQMVQVNRGRILFTSSIAGEMVAPREAVYAATKAFVLSLAHSLRYELKDKNVTVTALQPGPTDTEFFDRAGLGDTEVGQEGKTESAPAEVAKQGIEALLAGKDHVYSASMKTKVEGMLANATPGVVKGAMHEKMSRPQEERKAS